MNTGLVLGGAPDQPAVTAGGRSLSYAEFADLAGHMAGGGGLLSTHGLGVIDTLAAVVGAAWAGRPVVVGDPTGAPPDLGPLPPNTFLVAVTSGSSGHPRAIVRTLASWTESFAPLAELAGLSPTDRVLLTGPLHSTLHLFGALHTLWLGAELTDIPDRATAVHAVPTLLATLVNDPATGELRTAVVAGAALPAALAARASARGIQVLEYYGAAELSFVAARRPPAAFRPFPGAQVRADDGLLWVRSPYLALGYATADAGALRTEDGFATVGDLGAVHPDGTIEVFGRSDAAVTTGGSTVLAEDVEAVLTALPGVRAAAVVGLPHARLGQLLTAVVELAPGADLASVRAAARRSLTGAGLPRKWLLHKIPRTAAGKVARARLLAELTAPSEVETGSGSPVA